MISGLTPYFIATMLDHYTDRLAAAESTEAKSFLRQQHHYYKGLHKQTTFQIKQTPTLCTTIANCSLLAN